MIYYIEYSRKERKMVSFLPYPENERAAAQAHALQREKELSRLPGGLKMEIVMLKADSESTIRNTHARYFGNPLNADFFKLPTTTPA